MYCYNGADWVAFREEMTNISRRYYELNEYEHRSVENNWKYTCDNQLKAIDTYIPVKFYSNSENTPWMTPQLKRLIRKKHWFYNKAKKV